MTDQCGHPTEGGDGPPCQNPASDGDSCWIPAHGGSAENHGRPSKISQEIIDNITRLIAEGKSDTQAFRENNLHPSTKGNWLQKAGDPDDLPMEPNFDTDPYGYFLRRYEHARGLGEGWYVDNIMNIAVEDNDLATLMTMLKQRYPESWGDVDRGEQAGDQTVINLPESVVEQWQARPESQRQ